MVKLKKLSGLLVALEIENIIKQQYTFIVEVWSYIQNLQL